MEAQLAWLLTTQTNVLVLICSKDYKFHSMYSPIPIILYLILLIRFAGYANFGQTAPNKYAVPQKLNDEIKSIGNISKSILVTLYPK